MEVIKEKKAIKGANSDSCKTLEYSFQDKDLDLGIAVIQGRYPDSGYACNTISKELVYVLEGNGKLYFEKYIIEFEKGDAILILPNEKYYWESSFCKIAMACNPAWSVEQYQISNF